MPFPGNRVYMPHIYPNVDRLLMNHPKWNYNMMPTTTRLQHTQTTMPISSGYLTTDFFKIIGNTGLRESGLPIPNSIPKFHENRSKSYRSYYIICISYSIIIHFERVTYHFIKNENAQPWCQSG